MALDGIDLHLNPGDFVTVIGGNGAGKSTMLNMIAGVYPIDAGQILLEWCGYFTETRACPSKYLGRVFQDPMEGTAARNGNPGKPGACVPPGQVPRGFPGESKKKKKNTTRL